MSDCCQTRIDTVQLESRQRRLLIIVLVIDVDTFVADPIALVSLRRSGKILERLLDVLTFHHAAKIAR